MQRRPRSEFLIVAPVLDATPLMRIVGRLALIASKQIISAKN
jgi:hypothetical protein